MIGRHRVATIIVGILVVEVLMVVTGTGPDLLLVAGLGCLIGAAGWCAVDLHAAAVEADPLPVAHRTPPPTGVDRRVRLLSTGLRFDKHSDHSAKRVRDSLVELVDDQLVAKYGVDRTVDPAAAERILGPQLFRLVDDPDSARSVARPKNLTHIVTLIERL